MAAGIPLPTALQLISGVPLKKVGSVFMEKLSATKRLDGGALGNLMQPVLQNGNLSSIMQNPMAGLTGAIQGQISGLISQLQSSGIPNVEMLTNALSGGGGLDQAMGQFKAAGDNLSGLTNGAAGFFAMIGHDNFTQMAGSALPPSASMATVTAPINSAGFLSAVNTQLPIVVSAVLNGQMAPEQATDWVQTQTATAAAIVSGSAGALAWGQDMQTMVSTVSAVAGSLAVPPVHDGSGNRQNGAATGFQSVLGSVVQPGPRAAMAQAVEAQIAHTRHAPVDVAAMTSLED